MLGMPVRALALLAACMAAATDAKTVHVPIRFRTVSGIRPFLPVEINGRPFLLMLHANAGFFMMTNHANAAAAGVTVPPSTSAYGIERAGKVSALGRSTAKLSRLTVGGVAFSDLRLEVFETPQDPPMEGMLGIGWIRASRCIVDYDRSTVALRAAPNDGEDEVASIRRRGYTGHHMSWDEAARRFYVSGTLNGAPARFGVGTVSNDIVDVSFARSVGVELGPIVGQAGGPKGAVEDQYLAKRQVEIRIDGQATAPTQPLVWNISGYDGNAHSREQVTLGAEFMLANRAIIDFGSGTLFLPN